MFLTKRERQIISMLLEERGPLTNKELSVALLVSDRTIRNDIAGVNESLATEGYAIQSGNAGYYIPAGEMEWFRNLLKEEEGSVQAVYEDAFLRRLYILFQLLWIDIPVTMSDLSYAVFCSRTTVAKDIAGIREMLDEQDGVKLLAGHEGIAIEGKESSQRDLIGRILLESYEAGNHEAVKGILERLAIISEEEYRWMYNFLVNKTSLLNVTMTDRGIWLFTMENLVVFNRISMGFLLEEDYPETAYVHLPIHEIETHFGISFSNREISYIATKSAARSQINLVNSGIASEVQAIIDEYIEELSSYGIKPELLEKEKERLILHLASMLERVKENIHINSSLCLDIKQKYPYAFECAAAILPIIQKHFGVQISESEVSYIAVYLAVILDQIKGPANVAIVCASGVGTSMLLSCRLMKEFGERIHIVGTFPSYQADQILLECPETKLILSTIPFHHDMGVPVLEISPLLKMEDIRRIHQVLDHGTMKNMQRSVLQESLFHVFEKGNEEEILHKMAEMLQSEGCIEDTEAFLSSVKEREALYSTLYGKIWMPHPLHSFALKDGVACGLVKNNEKIRLVFMLCLRKEDTSLYNHFFDKIVTILEDEKAFDALFNVDGFEQFEKMFESLI